MEERGKSFHFNPFTLLAPALFIITAFVMRKIAPDLIILFYVLIILGFLFGLGTALNFTTLIISENELGLQKLRNGRVIHKDEISHMNQKVEYTRGAESVRWYLYLKDGSKVIISSDPFRETIKMKEALNWFLRDIPMR